MITKRKLDSHHDERGILNWVSPTILGFDYKYITAGSIEPGCQRGGHYHKKTYEQFLCLNGKITYIRDSDEQTIMEAGDVVEVPAGSMHTFINAGNETAYFLEFKDREFDKNDTDTFKDRKE